MIPDYDHITDLSRNLIACAFIEQIVSSSAVNSIHADTTYYTNVIQFTFAPTISNSFLLILSSATCSHSLTTIFWNTLYSGLAFRRGSLSSEDRLRIPGACACSHVSFFDTMNTPSEFGALVFSASATRRHEEERTREIRMWDGKGRARGTIGWKIELHREDGSEKQNVEKNKHPMCAVCWGWTRGKMRNAR